MTRVRSYVYYDPRSEYWIATSPNRLARWLALESACLAAGRTPEEAHARRVARLARRNAEPKPTPRFIESEPGDTP